MIHGDLTGIDGKDGVIVVVDLQRGGGELLKNLRDAAADLGGAVLALRLKAAELHLETCVEYSSDGDSLFACVQVYRN